jgi:hypothetical protein
MAGSATISGTQHYVLGIGHPMNEPDSEQEPAVGEGSGYPGATTVKSLEYYGLDASTGANFSSAMRAAVADMVDYASTRKGRTLLVEIPSCEAVHDGTTINMPSFAKFRPVGPVLLDAQGVTTPVFWPRADLDGYLPANQWVSAAVNQGDLFDTANGPLVIFGNLSSGGVAFRHGSGDGTMGTQMTVVDEVPYTILYRLKGIVIKGMDHALEYTNFHTFCIRHQDIRADGCNKGIVTSAATGSDFGEISNFDECFFSNTLVTNVEMNSAHQFEFSGGSMPFCRGDNITINADLARLIFSAGQRFEAGETVSNSTGAYPRSVVVLNGAWITPSRKADGVTSESTYLRRLFKGQHQVQLNGAVFDMTGATAFTTTTAAGANLFAGDANTVVRGTYRVLQRSSASIKAVPIITRYSLIPNADFAADLTGWSTGPVGTATWLSSDGNTTNGCLSLSVTAGQAFVYAPRARVDSGKLYAADAAFKLLSSPTPTSAFQINMRLNWYQDAIPKTLGSNTLTTGTAGTGTVTVTWANHGIKTGEYVELSGATAVDGITAAQLAGKFKVTYLTASTFSILTTGSATTGGVAGGGSAMIGMPPATYMSSTSYAAMTFTASTFQDGWYRHGGTGSTGIEAPSGATYCRLEIGTGSAHTGTLLIDDAMMVELA